MARSIRISRLLPLCVPLVLTACTDTPAAPPMDSGSVFASAQGAQCRQGGCIPPGTGLQLSIDPQVLSMDPGGSVPATIQASTGIGAPIPSLGGVTWSMANPTIASVGTDGTVTGLTRGYTEVTATAGGTSTSASVLVGARLVVGNVFIGMPVGSSVAIDPALVSTANGAFLGQVPGAVWTTTDPAVIASNGSNSFSAVGIGVGRVEARVGTIRDTMDVLVTDGTMPLAWAMTGNTNGYHVTGRAGASFSRDVYMMLPGGSATGDIGSASGTLRFDPAVVQFDGFSSAVAGAIVNASVPTAGTVAFSYSNAAPSGSAFVLLVRLNFTILPNAPAGTHMAMNLAYATPPTRTDGSSYLPPLSAGGKLIVVP